MKKFTKKSLEKFDNEKLSGILTELCDCMGYSEEQQDELFEDIIKRTPDFELDRDDVISWILLLQEWKQLRSK